EYPTNERDAINREHVYSYTGNSRAVCTAFAATFDQLYADRDTDEFEFNWRQPFPYREYEKFKAKMN
ncbi:MAG: hypothetical protein ABIV21_07240, partial [Pyrinomonadaceae bacterium]